jgi:hypothetical protein
MNNKEQVMLILGIIAAVFMPFFIYSKKSKIMLGKIFGNTCCICGQRDKKTVSIEKPGIYSGSIYYYHPKCLIKCAANPEKYGHRAADMTIEIFDLKKKAKERSEKARQAEKESYKKVKKMLATVLAENEKFQKEYEKLK